MSYMRSIARSVAKHRMEGMFQDVNEKMGIVDKSGNKQWRNYTAGKFREREEQVNPERKYHNKKISKMRYDKKMEAVK